MEDKIADIINRLIMVDGNKCNAKTVAHQIATELKQDLIDMVEIDPHLLKGLIVLRKMWQLDQAEKGLFRAENSDEDLVHTIMCARPEILKLKEKI